MVSGLYLKEANKRAVFSFEDLPEKIKQRILSCKEELLTRHPDITKLYLTGSYVMGEYIDEETPEEFRKLKEETKRRCKISDIDFISEPKKFDFFTASNGYTVHLVPIAFPKTRKISLADNNNSHGDYV